MIFYKNMTSLWQQEGLLSVKWFKYFRY